MAPANSRHPAIRVESGLTARPSLARLFAKVPDKPTRNGRIHEALRVHGYTLQEVGDPVGLHYSTASRIASRVASKAETLRRR